MDAIIQGVLIGEKLIIGGDLNGQIGKNNNNNYEWVHCGCGYGSKIRYLICFRYTKTSYVLVIPNTCFKKMDEQILFCWSKKRKKKKEKRDEHLITYRSGLNFSQIDCILLEDGWVLWKNCKIILGESLTTKYRLMVLDMPIPNNKTRNYVGRLPKTRWWIKKGENYGLFINYLK